MIYINKNKVTLYKTLLFNNIDTVMFKSKIDRDNYFNNIIDKIEFDEFTDLYETRQLVLPRNYLELKKYNVMRLHYDDGLGHIEDYYCNVDNYLYVNNANCTPIYRIDYFLTFGYMLYNKKLDIVTDRRTVNESNVTKYMKPDEMIVPKLYYQPLFIGSKKEHNYIIFLNKVKEGVIAKQGIKASLTLLIGFDDNNVGYNKEIETYTTGCYILITDEVHFSTLINSIPMEYIEKIMESDITQDDYIGSLDRQTWDNQGYVYLTEDITLNPGLIINVEDNMDTKKIMQSLPYNGYIVNGFEYNPYDFDSEYLPVNDNVTKVSIKPSLQVFSIFGESFLYPIAYKGNSINYDYMQNWTSGRSFSYISNYTNSLAYKELVERNAQAVQYANSSAGLTSYYSSMLANNMNKQLDTSKLQSSLSYQSTINSLNTQLDNLEIEKDMIPVTTMDSFFGGGLLGLFSNLFTQAPKTTANYATNKNNKNLLNSQITNLSMQNDVNSLAIDLQKSANNMNAQYQSDTAGLSRDNTIANISISNKYNNSKPNAYSGSEYNKYNSYIYKMGIDNRNGTDYTQYENIVNYYNINGIKVGYIEEWNTANLEGNFYHYIKGSIIENSNYLTNNIPLDILIQLLARIENGVRLWHNLDWFGNLTTDNTSVGTLPPYNEFSLIKKRNLEKYVLSLIWNHTKSEVTTIINSNPDYLQADKDYLNWYNESLYWGTTDISQARKYDILQTVWRLQSIYSNIETINLIKSDDNLTIYEVQFVITTIS